MSSDIPKKTDALDLSALTTIVTALRPLDESTRMKVVESALILLGNQARQLVQSNDSSLPIEPVSIRKNVIQNSEGRNIDIRQLKQEKLPQSANEMVALVAYYLAEEVPAGERKSEINMSDVQKFFKQAQFPLPSNPQMTLVHAKNAGYFDSAGNGQYRLNPVGYNLVAHNMPRSASSRSVAPKAHRANRRHAGK